MKPKFLYEKPEIDFIKIGGIDIMTASTPGTNKPEDDWEDENVSDDGWL